MFSSNIEIIIVSKVAFLPTYHFQLTLEAYATLLNKKTHDSSGGKVK